MWTSGLCKERSVLLDRNSISPVLGRTQYSIRVCKSGDISGVGDFGHSTVGWLSCPAASISPEACNRQGKFKRKGRNGEARYGQIWPDDQKTDCRIYFRERKQ
jgi:hypothetical protein